MMVKPADAKDVKRTKVILKIEALELLKSIDTGMELNEGYDYFIDGSLPMLADAISKMLIGCDNDTSLGEKSGQALLTLIGQYYELNKNEGGENA